VISCFHSDLNFVLKSQAGGTETTNSPVSFAVVIIWYRGGWEDTLLRCDVNSN